MSEKDVKDASAGVLQDLKRFQRDKEGDLRRYMVGSNVSFSLQPPFHSSPPIPLVLLSFLLLPVHSGLIQYAGGLRTMSP